ncbi:MAG: hypothetical protein QM764_21635 [Chitinophagaceae bacterium]
MNRVHFIISLIVTCVIFTSCTSGYVVRTWKNENAFPGNYNKILIIAIVNPADSALRRTVETNFKNSFQSAGYTALCSFEEFGASLRDLDQEETYKSLCEKGIDAIFIAAITDRGTGSKLDYRSLTDPVKYYYDQVWFFKEHQNKLPGFTGSPGPVASWEMILFDLPTLQPHYIARTPISQHIIEKSFDQQFWDCMVRKLHKDRFLKRRRPLTVDNPSLKAF